MKHPVVVNQEKVGIQTRISDWITDFAGSMVFLYLHLLWFGVWIIFKVEKYPYGLLTMIVSLEAILLSTFVMISQNRQAAFAEAKANHDFVEQEQELKLNTELTKAVHALATEIHIKLGCDVREEEGG